MICYIVSIKYTLCVGDFFTCFDKINIMKICLFDLLFIGIVDFHSYTIENQAKRDTSQTYSL